MNTTDLRMAPGGQRSFNTMLDDYRDRRSAHEMLGEHDAIRALDESVITALTAMIRLGGLALSDVTVNGNPALFVNREDMCYGVNILNQLGGRWSVDS
jgi:hypothetical protein